MIRLLIPALKLMIGNIKSYIFIFILLVCCSVLINVRLSELFSQTRYSDDLLHFYKKEAYVLSQFFTAESGVPSLSDDELVKIDGISRVTSCNCGRTTLGGLLQGESSDDSKDIYVAYTTNGYTDEVRIKLHQGRLPRERSDNTYEILVSKSLSSVLKLNNEYTFKEFDELYNVVVVGILSENEPFLSLSGMGSASSYFREITSDPAWIIIPREHSYIKSFIKIIFLDPSLNDEQKSKLITDLNSRYGYINSFEDIYNDFSESVRHDILEKLPVCLLLILICLISTVGCVSLNTLNDMKSYSIFRIYGATKNDCIIMSSVMNLLGTILALVFSAPAFNIYVAISCKISPYISWRNYLITLSVFAVTFVISALIPYSMLSKTAYNLYNDT